MTILDKIVQHKKIETAENKELYPVKLLEKSKYFETKPVSLKKYILRPDKSGIIAEFKRKSPSKGMINEYVKVEDVTLGYMQAGASALSVLTDKNFFGGKCEDLIEARNVNYCPILRKDFVIDEYQIIKAKSIGADAILLIASILEKQEVENLAKFAKSLGLEILFEVHNKEELQKLSSYVDLVGVNNRNLNDFTVDTNTSLELLKDIPSDFAKISESGIHSPDVAADLKSAGYDGFLIGEQFMKSGNPGKACLNFIKTFNSLVNLKISENA